MSYIDEFITLYSKEQEKYVFVEKYAKSRLESELRDSGIMSIVTSRIKDVDRLREKLSIRNINEKYNSISDIKKDIVDLIGVRVALYFPDDNEKVERIINRLFNVEKTKYFPDEQRTTQIYERRFLGYCATHYRVYLKETKVRNINTDQFLIEIQVASLLMHAWAEVEHDLSYKQKKGEVSFDELESLDEINGLVLTGELALQRLQRISELRILTENKKFSNHYQLATFLYDKVESKNENSDFLLGDVETLFRVLEDQNRLTPKKVINDIEKINTLDKVPVAQQLVDLITSGNARITNLAIKTKNDKTSLKNQGSVNDNIVGAFVKKWVVLEKILSSLSPLSETIKNSSTLRHVLYDLRDSGVISSETLKEYRFLREIRNALVHGREVIDDIYLEESIQRLDALIIAFRKASETSGKTSKD